MSTARMSKAEYRQIIAAPKRSKYGAKRTEVDGIVFDSAAEANRYIELKALEDIGDIAGLKRQEPFSITAGPINKLVATYRADFSYWDNTLRRQVVEDVKGMDTPLSKLKRKLVEAIHGVTITVVKTR